MRVIRAINPEGALRLPADEGQVPTLNYTSGTSGRAKGVIYHHRGAYLMVSLAGWTLPPRQVVLSQLAADRVTETEVFSLYRNNIAHINAPKTGAFHSLPKTTTGKIQKFILLTIAREMGSQP